MRLMLFVGLCVNVLCGTTAGGAVQGQGPVVETEYGLVEGFVNDSLSVNVNVFHDVRTRQLCVEHATSTRKIAAARVLPPYPQHAFRAELLSIHSSSTYY